MRNWIWTYVVALLLVAGSAAAQTKEPLTSRDLCPVSNPCDQHYLEWRAISTDPWIVIGAPLPLSPTTHPDVTGPFPGVVWTGYPVFGEFQARAMRSREVSLPSNIIDRGPESNPEMVPSPQLFAMLAGCSITRNIN